jgi:Protein of unknown function (DUF3616)
MPPSSPSASATLEFDQQQLIVGQDTDIRLQLSAVALDSGRLWLACDEGCRLERLSQSSVATTFAAHQVFALKDLLTLPAPPKEEADVEGLYVDNGWLWLVGSHSVKRKKPKGESQAETASKLLDTKRDGNRHLLARIPIAGGNLLKTDGGRHAASLEATQTSSALLDAIRSSNDDHLGPFVDLPGKDNGLDIEGLAARDMRVWIGLRGPVLREWCCILELHLDAQGDRLRLVADGASGSYRKHFVKLHGLAVRDLIVLENDLLILTGPTMAHDAPSEIWQWKNGAKDSASPTPADLKCLITLPQRQGDERPEGLALFEHGASSTSVLVVFDAPSEARRPTANTVLADVYRLP